MPSSNLSKKTKADLVVLAELSGLMTAAKARRTTKAALLELFAEAESANQELGQDQPPQAQKEKTAEAESDQKTVTDAAQEDAPQAAATKTKAAKTPKRATNKKTTVKKAVTPKTIDKKTTAKKTTPRATSTTKTRSVKTIEAAEATKTDAPHVKGKSEKEATLPALAAASDEHSEIPTDSKSGQTLEDISIEDKKAKEKVAGDTDKKTEAEKEKTSAPGKQRRVLVEPGEQVAGILEIMSDGYGFLRKDNYLQGNKDIYVPPQYIRRFNLRTGDYVSGPGKAQRDTDRYQALLYVKEVNGLSPDKMHRRPTFDRLTPVYPDERFCLETTRNELSTRIIDLAAPIGKGQRGMIVSPPKAGKTILLQKIANAISINNPEVKLIVLLIDERPEEVTDMQRSIKGEVVYSTFDKTPENHVKVTELVLERAMRLVELKQDVVILLDSMTRLARAYNLTINPTGRTLSGGLDPGALYGPKRFFGAARNIEHGGSLTIIATSLIETGSRMDEVIFEEFKGTGNMEVYLDRKLSEKRIFPAIDINRSGTRREELLMSEKELDAVWTIRKAFSQLDTAAVTETIINLLLKTQNNNHFISSINVSFNDKNVFEAMRGARTGGSNTNGNGTTNGNTSR